MRIQMYFKANIGFGIKFYEGTQIVELCDLKYLQDNIASYQCLGDWYNPNIRCNMIRLGFKWSVLQSSWKRLIIFSNENIYMLGITQLPCNQLFVCSHITKRFSQSPSSSAILYIKYLLHILLSLILMNIFSHF